MSASRDDRRERPGPIDGWPDADFDAVLHLLDRQIVDVDGLLVGNVDDVEIVEDPDGSLVPTALLVGMAALVPRFGDWVYQRWLRLDPADAGRNQPGVIELDLVEDVTSEVHLSVKRDGILHPHAEEPPGHPVRRTLGTLISMRVAMPPEAGPVARRARVLDVRLRARTDAHGVRVESLIVGRGRPGSMLGYERSPERGPWLVAELVRWLHRHSRLVEIGQDVEIDWETRTVRVGPGADVRPLG